MNIMLIRNAQRRRTLFWPVLPGRLAPIAAGAAFEVHSAELEENPELRAVLRILVREGLVAVEAIGNPPLH